MYRVIGFVLMIIGTLVILILGSLVLIWVGIVSVGIPKESISIEESAELVPTES